MERREKGGWATRQAGTRSNVLPGRCRCCCCCCSTLLVSPLQCTEKKRNIQEIGMNCAQQRPQTLSSSDSGSGLCLKTSSASVHTTPKECRRCPKYLGKKKKHTAPTPYFFFLTEKVGYEDLRFSAHRSREPNEAISHNRVTL